MEVLRSIEDYRVWRASLPLAEAVGCVPTMGALHAGHGSLIERSAAENAHTVVTLFVNPTQFNDPADFQAYPNNLDGDLRAAEAAGASAVFAPDRDSLYPDDYTYRVTELAQSTMLEGAHRPGHFDGVLTVVLKLLNVTQPHRAYFGEKDWQQLQLIRGMVAAFFLPIEIVPCPTVRDADGLALSSRNQRLSREDRARAAQFPQILRNAATPEAARAALEAAGFRVDYVEDHANRRLAAIHHGGVRLIDNLPLDVVQKNTGGGT
ncbi:MAG: pantoate--beta-alanine ligase [Verrucomicrobiota bacterium]